MDNSINLMIIVSEGAVVIIEVAFRSSRFATIGMEDSSAVPSDKGQVVQ